MPEISQDQLNILDAMSKLVRGSSSSFTQQRSETPSSGKPQTAEDKANRIRADKASQKFNDASKSFERSVRTDYKTKEQWKLQVEQNGKFLDSAISSINSQSNLGAAAFGGLEDMFKSQEQLEALLDIRETFKQNKGKMSGDEMDKLEQKVKSLGLTFSELGINTKKEYTKVNKLVGSSYVEVDKIIHTGTIPNYTKLNDKLTENSKKLKKSSDGLEEMAKSADSARTLTQGIVATAGMSAKLFLDESRIAMRHGVADARDAFGDTAMMVAKLGISTSQYMQIMADNRPVQLAMQSAGKSFKNELVTMSNSLMNNKLVGSMEEATNATVGFIRNTSLMGVAQSDLVNASKAQEKIFQDNFRALGMSTDQFNALTEDLISDVDIRKDLAKLQGNERRAYIESLQKRTAENVMMGYSIEKAKELNKHFAKMSAENPLERLSKAAKMRTGLGVLGMGKEGARYQELSVKLPTMNAEERVAAEKEMTEIQAKAQAELSRRMGESVAANISLGEIFGSGQLGLIDGLNEFDSTTRAGMKIAKDGQSAEDASAKASQNQANRGEVDDTTMGIVRLADTFEAGRKSSATFMATAGMTWLAGVGLQKGLGIMEGLLTKIAVTGVGAGTTGMGGSAATKLAKGAGVVGAVMIGWEVGTAIGDQITEAWQGTDSYSAFSQGIGTFADSIAQLWDKDAAARMMGDNERAAIAKEQLAETKRQTEAAEKAAADATKLSAQANQDRKDGISVQERANIVAATQNRLANTDKRSPTQYDRK